MLGGEWPSVRIGAVGGRDGGLRDASDQAGDWSLIRYNKKASKLAMAVLCAECLSWLTLTVQ